MNRAESASGEMLNAIVGRIEERSTFDSALDALGSFHESFEAVIDRVYVENIDPSEQSLIERVFDLE